MLIKKEPKDALEKWKKTMVKNSRSATKYRTIGAVFSLVLAIVFYMFTAVVFVYPMGIVSQIFVVVYVNIPTVIFIAYFVKNSNQAVNEDAVRNCIYKVRKNIRAVKQKKENFRTLQNRLNRTRKNLKAFIDFSKVITPPISNYEVDRLQKEIDIFFNTTSEVLFPINLVFSQEHQIQLQQNLNSFTEKEETIDDADNQQELDERRHLGSFSTFDLDILDQFFKYLGDVLFAPTEPYSIWSFKHSINVITLSQFFSAWNEKISICSNCVKTYKKAKKDIEQYYSELRQRETQRRERYNELLIVIVSVLISTGINAILRFFNV